MNTQHLPESIAAFLAPVKRRGSASSGGASKPKRAQKRRPAAPRIGVYLRLGSSTFADPVTMARIIEVHNRTSSRPASCPTPSLCLTSTPRAAAGPKWLRHARAVGRATLAAGPTASRGAWNLPRPDLRDDTPLSPAGVTGHHCRGHGLRAGPGARSAVLLQACGVHPFPGRPGRCRRSRCGCGCWAGLGQDQVGLGVGIFVMWVGDPVYVYVCMHMSGLRRVT